jgi:hypothetical protein
MEFAIKQNDGHLGPRYADAHSIHNTETVYFIFERTIADDS